MANDTEVTVVGYLASDPELRFTPSGAAVVNVTVATTPRRFDKDKNEWADKETLYLRGSAWRDFAENVAESFHKGDRVIVVGNLVSRQWEKDGDKRYSTELEINEMGASARFARLKITKNSRPDSNNGTPPPSEGGTWDPSFAPQSDANPPF